MPHAPTGLRVLEVSCGREEGPGLLLSCMSRLKCLTKLDLDVSDTIAWQPPGPAYYALTASSRLVSLSLVAKFPAGVWPFVLSATRQLPHLTYLEYEYEPAARCALGLWGGRPCEPCQLLPQYA